MRRTPAGWCTRYGPVDELVGDRKDSLVLLNGGDELALSFKAALTLIGHCLFARRKSKAPAPAEVEAAANWKEVAP